MSNLNDISIDKIEIDIMSILYANIDTIFTHYSLFNKLVRDKYDLNNTNSITIHSNFKSKFLLVVRNLMANYDNIKITKENNIYNIVCLSSQDIKTTKFFSFLNDTKISLNYIELNDNDITSMYDYIYENNLNEYINWSDPFDGNSIFHELVANNNIKQIEKLINNNTFNYTIINNHNQTPIDLINSPATAKILTMLLIKNYNIIKNILEENQEKKYLLMKKNNDKFDYYESIEYKNKIINDTRFIDIILTKTNKYNFYVNMYIYSFIICYLIIKFIV